MTGGMLVAAYGWWGAALSDLSVLRFSQAPVPIAEGLQALVRLAAATAWTLLTAIMAAGTAAVVPLHRRIAGPGEVEVPPMHPAHHLPARVASALLVATCAGPSVSVAAATPATFTVAQHGDAAVGAPSQDLADLGDATEASSVEEVCTDHRDTDGSGPGHRDTDIPVPGWLPAPRAAAPDADVALLARGTEEDRVVTVRRGDTLWSIAAGQLDGPTAEQIAAAWPRWYAANRDVIGPDPDLIRPGQQLHRPSTSSEGALP